MCCIDSKGHRKCLPFYPCSHEAVSVSTISAQVLCREFARWISCIDNSHCFYVFWINFGVILSPHHYFYCISTEKCAVAYSQFEDQNQYFIGFERRCGEGEYFAVHITDVQLDSFW